MHRSFLSGALAGILISTSASYAFASERECEIPLLRSLSGEAIALPGAANNGDTDTTSGALSMAPRMALAASPDAFNGQQESERLQWILRSVAEGALPASAIPLTPAGQEVEFYEAPATGQLSIHRKGRIAGARYAEGGQTEILFLNRIAREIYEDRPTPIALSKIEPTGVVRVKKVVTLGMRAITFAKLQEAFQTGCGIRYVDQQVGFIPYQGRVVGLEARSAPESMRSFDMGFDSGETMGMDMRFIDPDTIELFELQPRPLNDIERVLLKQIAVAKTINQYISLKIASIATAPGLLFEGWVTGIAVATDGEYLIRLNPLSAVAMRSQKEHRLSAILADSFEGRPGRNLELEPALSTELSAPTRQLSPNIDLQEIFARLLEGLSPFANPEIVSGQELPAELKAQIRPGEERRLYFASGERQIRLTIRRTNNGDWAFGNTCDLLYVDEQWRHSDGQRYSNMENIGLNSEVAATQLPAALLRRHLRSIRDSLR